MGITLGDAIVYLRGDRSGLDKDLGAAEKQTRSWASRLGGGVAKLAGGAIVGGATAAAGAITGIGVAAAKAAFDAMPLEGIGKAFQGITADADETMAALRTGSLGMVSDAELMRGYNEAAQLVGKSFADDLPDAMGYLSKVSAATGQDMGYMLDSLTKGVGRMSPMILDNLGIQVNLAEANAAYAASIGITADALTKEQQQTALMNQVMEKLAQNTADMPDVTDNVATSWSQLGTQAKNIKDSIGIGLLPVLTALLSPLRDLGMWLGPKLSAVAEYLGPLIGEKLTGAFSSLIPKTQGLWVKLQDVWGWLKTTAIPVAQEWYDKFSIGMRTTVGIARAYLSLLYNKLESGWNWITGTAIPKLKEWAAAFKEGFAPFAEQIIPRLREFIEQIKPKLDAAGVALRAMWDKLSEALGRLAEKLGLGGDGSGKFAGKLGELVGWLLGAGLDLILNGITLAIDGLTLAIGVITGAIDLWIAAFDTLWGAIDNIVGGVKDLGGAFEDLTGIDLPDWLTPGSPTPFERGLKGIAKAISSMPDLGAALALPAAGANLRGALSGIGGGQSITDNRQSVTMYGAQFNGVQDAGGLLEQLQALA